MLLFFQLKIMIFTAFKDRCILHRHVFVMIYYGKYLLSGFCSFIAFVCKLHNTRRKQYHGFTVIIMYY